MAIGLRYQALANKQIDVVNGYATDGMISAEIKKRLGRQNLWPPVHWCRVRKDASTPIESPGAQQVDTLPMKRRWPK
jgi:glycine betaine/choline ABC-type transport system substrate-binding protein